RREVTFSRIAFIDRHLRHNPLALQLQIMLEQAKMPWTVARFTAYCAILLFLGVAVGRALLPEGFIGWVPGILLGFVPLGWVLFKRSGRLHKLNKQLPD